MLYRKNLPMWERVLRVLAGAGLIVYGVVGGLSLPVVVFAVASAVAVIATGFIGYCPACAVAGRKHLNQHAQQDQMNSHTR